jgi:hypothetical protein
MLGDDHADSRQVGLLPVEQLRALRRGKDLDVLTRLGERVATAWTVRPRLTRGTSVIAGLPFRQGG